jgi:hypothetical protein
MTSSAPGWEQAFEAQGYLIVTDAIDPTRARGLRPQRRS